MPENTAKDIKQIETWNKFTTGTSKPIDNNSRGEQIAAWSNFKKDN